MYTVTGKLSIAEMEKSHQETDPILQQGSNWKILVVLQDFEGWEKEEGWANTSLIDETDQSPATNQMWGLEYLRHGCR